MPQILQIGESLFEQLRQNKLPQAEIMPLLNQYQMLPQLLRESLIDEAIAPFSCTLEGTEVAYKEFCDRHQLNTDKTLQRWLTRYGMTQSQLKIVATRQKRIEQFKLATWGNQLESYFLKRKGSLDQVIYSLLRTQDRAIAQEFYFRIREGEQSFAELARAYSQGAEAQTGGLCGPVELSILPPMFSRFLTLAEPGQLSAPIQLGEWVVLLRLEQLIPAQLNEPMRHRLLSELFENWIQEQLEHRCHAP